MLNSYYSSILENAAKKAFPLSFCNVSIGSSAIIQNKHNY